ncbi:hypothetical protein ACE198_24625 [Neobacillus sp. KR4-4]|uniref:hypothetical protein n=1 Tax=Neobacillus sp. KR4-4 TaxID=3344872 RepID=UPI0035CCA388
MSNSTFSIGKGVYISHEIPKPNLSYKQIFDDVEKTIYAWEFQVTEQHIYVRAVLDHDNATTKEMENSIGCFIQIDKASFRILKCAWTTDVFIEVFNPQKSDLIVVEGVVNELQKNESLQLQLLFGNTNEKLKKAFEIVTVFPDANLSFL